MAIIGSSYTLPDAPIILANNLLIGQPVTATSAAYGFPALAVTNPLTYERWAPATGGSNAVTIDLPPIRAFNTVAIAAHTLGTNGVTFTIAGFTSLGGWVDLTTQTPTTDEPFVLCFGFLKIFTKLRITINKQAEIGVVYAGLRLNMPLSIYGGHTPDTMGRETDIKTARSVSGNFLGRTVVRRGYEARYEFKHLGAAWYRSHFEPFAKDAITNPFIIAWYPSKYPNEVIYGWVEQDIVGRNMGVRDFMETSFTVKAIGDGQ
jgi:hypothetical protein